MLREIVSMENCQYSCENVMCSFFSYRFDTVFSQNLMEFYFLTVIAVLFVDVGHILSYGKSKSLSLVLKLEIFKHIDIFISLHY